MPDGIMPAYAVTVTTVCEFWPSLLFALDDRLMSQHFLALCVTSYNPKGMIYHPLVTNSEYLSPRFNAKDETLKQSPKTRMIVAGIDSFKDDNIRMAHRILKAGAKDVRICEFRMMPHGFLSTH